MKTYKIALADDHTLMRRGLATLINTFEEYEVIFQGTNGQELIDSLDKNSLPHIAMLDINMPKKDGYETAYWLKTNYPQVKILALSMYDNEIAIIRMLQNGARGYILKDAEPFELKEALDGILQKGFHYSDLITGHLLNNITRADEKHSGKGTFLTDRELEFLKLCCTEMAYKDIAEKMFLSPRTLENYRDSLFEKLHAKSRIGLVIYAMKSGIVNLSNH